MLEKVRDTIRSHNLLSKGDRVLVALSGGPDSVALLHLLSTLRDQYRLHLHALYINHGIRKAPAKTEEKFCADLCRRLDVEFEIVREDIPQLARNKKRGVEETGREFRYATFERIADERRLNRIAVGHHADDQAETVLFRILRGTGRRGLAGIPIKRGKIIRPLLQVERGEIMQYLKTHRLQFCLDQSNTDSRYRRNFLREKLIPLIRKELNPNVSRALVDLADNMADEEALLEGIVANAADKLIKRSPAGKIALDLPKLMRYDRWIRRRLLRYCLAETSGGSAAPDKEVIDRLEKTCANRANGMTLPGGIQATRIDDRMVIYPGRKPGFHHELTVGQPLEMEFPRINLQARIVRRKPGGSVKPAQRRPTTVRIDADKVSIPLRVRNIRPGDRFRPLGMRGTKKIGDYLTDRKVHPVYRDEIPVVEDTDGIVWLVGFEIADRVKIDATTRKVLRIDCSER